MKMKIVSMLLASLILIICAFSSVSASTEAVSSETRVWLTVSPVVSTQDELVRVLEIHWLRPKSSPQPDPGDYVAIVPLSDGKEVKRYRLNATDNSNTTNVIRTDLTFPAENVTSGSLDAWRSSKSIVYYDLSSPEVAKSRVLNNCMHYHVIYWSAKLNKTMAADCIKMNYRWMQDNFDILKNHTLLQIMLPGAHDATSYEPYNPAYESDVLTRFQYTQDESIFGQLAYGVRYFDLRVGAFNKTDFDENMQPIVFDEELWFVHDIERNHINVTSGLRQIRRFLNQTTHEVVIVDFHRFVTGFDGVDDLEAVNRRLQRLCKVLSDELGDYLIPFGTPLTLGELISSGRRVLVGYQYKNDEEYFDAPFLWPNVQHLWAQTDEMEQLERFIEANVCQKHSYLTSVMAELTPTIAGALFQKYHGLRELAEQVNIHYDQWFRERWWKCANIVAADFFLGSDIVEIAVDVNRRRFEQQV